MPQHMRARKHTCNGIGKISPSSLGPCQGLGLGQNQDGDESSPKIVCKEPRGQQVTRVLVVAAKGAYQRQTDMQNFVYMM